MAASIVEICNLAILKIGGLKIASIEDLTKEGRACKVFFPILRNELLESYPWPFALTRADISAQLATTPSFQWDYAYTIPSDCLRVIELYGTDSEWVVENGQLLTNQEEEIYIRYIKLIETSGSWSPSFDTCLSLRLAAELATILANDNNLRISLLEELNKVALPRAQSLVSKIGKPPKHKDEQAIDAGNFSWQTEGR